jgi:ferredoxin-NADP reductase
MSDFSAATPDPIAKGQKDDLDLKVVDRVRESEHVVSLVLAPVDADAWVPFKAGQHLAFRLQLPKRPIATYTISSSPAEKGIYRISVKREAAGFGGSAYLHDHAQVGTTLRAARPRGTFHLSDDVQSVVLLTGGIGVTPAVSMLKDLVKRQDLPVHFIHAVRNRREHSFWQEISDVAAAASNVSTFISYDEASEEDLAGGYCNRVGPIDRECLRRLLPLDRHTVYLCGPNGFMTAMRNALLSLGVPESSIHQENFGGAPAIAPLCTLDTSSKQPTANAGTMVRFTRSGVEATWQKKSGSLLELAEQNGINPDFSCRAGVCGTCSCRLVSGQIEYDEQPLDELPEGDILICCARPVGAISLDL